MITSSKVRKPGGLETTMAELLSIQENKQINEYWYLAQLILMTPLF